jgi:uncharacterized protein YciI
MWFLCLRKAVRPRESWAATVDEHLAWMKTQHDQGAIYLSGPATTAEGRVGMYLIRANDRAGAERVAAADPFTVAGDCTFELIEWEIHQMLGIGPFTSAGLSPTAAPAPNR